ncbi:DUF5753 domain-containing protein [Streptomyces finlayi]|uniref:DUF5753 domain-containing protein n=1 Tax=Streptomyces finlayi TaxID=67296 RepID=UPI0021565D01|nr:DUF5753 domain-containing protein [Streptomyces finlayi]
MGLDPHPGGQAVPHRDGQRTHPSRRGGCPAPVVRLVDREVVSALEGLAKDARKQGWWQTYSGVVAPAYADYISLESDAANVHEFAPLLVPGLLQTASYTRETIAADAPTRTPGEVAALAEVRQARQAVLIRPQHAVNLTRP